MVRVSMEYPSKYLAQSHRISYQRLDCYRTNIRPTSLYASFLLKEAQTKMKTVIIDGKTLTPDEIKLLAELVSWGFDSSCEDFTTAQEKKYRNIIDKYHL